MSGCSDAAFGLLVVGGDGPPLGGTSGRDVTVDFGAVRTGTRVERKITLRNAGTADLTLVSLEGVEGDPVHVGEVVEGSVWSVSFTPGAVIAPGESLALDAAFQPPVADQPSQEHFAVLILTAEDVAAGSGTARLTFIGTGIATDCDAPTLIDFGKAALEDSVIENLVVTNPTSVPVKVSLGAITGADGVAFALEPNFPREFELGAGATRQVPVLFRPVERRTHVAFLEFSPSQFCGTRTVELRGTGVDSVLSWTPSQVNCGFANPGTRVTQELVFTNDSRTPIELFDIRTLNNLEFGPWSEPGIDPTRLTVPPLGTAALGLWCKPAQLGPRQTSLTFTTDLPKQPSGSVVVRVYGGGPDIQVEPYPSLDFGKVAFFANANPPVFQKRSLWVTNVGSASSPGEGNLRLGRVDATGTVIPDTYFTVTPLNGDTQAGEFSVELPPGYDPQVGLPATVGKASLRVRITPESLGLKQAEITIHSNDPDEPQVKVTVTANVMDLPPCDFSVMPTPLAFGLISPPDYRDLAFKVKNNGTNAGELCLLSGLDLGPESHAFFSLPSGPIDNLELAPGETRDVLVRVWPQGTTPTGVTHISGTVVFYMSSPLQPQMTVTLSAQVAPSCLFIAPDEFDLGTVQVGCTSATKTFSIYNTCSSPVTVNGFRILNAPATDPSCLSWSGCEFMLTSSPSIPAGGLVIPASSSVPTTFQVKYRPKDFGADVEAVAINATQYGTNVTYLVPLKGAGDSLGIQTDTYVQDAKPKADLLLVIDNSTSMGWAQQALAANFASFIKYANTAQVDFRIAVVHTDPTMTDYKKFLSGPSHPEKVLTPTTVDLENKFKAKVNVGMVGGVERGAEPALGALTAPMINSDNAGFLRPAASLAVVVVTDENDQSPMWSTYYLNGFWNIKGHARRTLFTFNAIASFDPACPSSPDTGEYAFYVAQTGGVQESICTPDWAKALEKMGQTAFGFRTRFFLTSTPDLSKGPIDVRIDGVAIPTIDPKGGATIWSFDALSNAVNFGPMYVPEPGQTLTVTYHVTCYP